MKKRHTNPKRSPGPQARPITLTTAEHDALRNKAASATAPYREVQRARMILLAADGLNNEHVARRIGASSRTVRIWRERFDRWRFDGLKDRHRSGRPATIPSEARCEVVKMACDRPEKVPFRDVWTHETLRDAVEAKTGCRMSLSEIGRTLNAEQLRPHRMRVWLHSPDPDFQSKVERICGLYLSAPAGATVLCVDEKTSIQALERKHDTVWPQPGRAGRREFEYIRHGTTNLFAAFNVANGQVFGRCSDQRKATDLMAFMEELAQEHPTGDVYIVWDNLNTHHDGPDKRWTKFNARHGKRFHFVYTPIHASWVNQVEVFFGIMERRIIKHGDYASRDALIERISGFLDYWNANEAHAFKWTFRGKRWQTRGRQAA